MNLLVGDSHSNFLSFQNSVHLLCSAGSAKGLANPNSKSQYNKKIIDFVESKKDIKRIFFLFGGVDVDFCFIHKLINHKVRLHSGYAAFNADVISNYLNFILTHFSDKECVVLSIGLPTLDDAHLKKGLLNGHVNKLEAIEIKSFEKQLDDYGKLPNIVERTHIAWDFNHQLKQQIEKLNKPELKFLDITSFTLNPETKHIREEYFTRYDHHNSRRNPRIIEIINKFLETAPDANKNKSKNKN